MDEVLQAKMLLKRVRNALKAMKVNDDFPDLNFEEEVIFRYEAIVGILIMAKNEIQALVKKWAEDHEGDSIDLS
jgi:hypothetical protein